MQVASMKSMMKKIVFVENYKKSIKYFFLIATLIFFVFCKKTEKPSTTYGFKGGDFSLHSYKGMFSLDQVRIPLGINSNKKCADVIYWS